MTVSMKCRVFRTPRRPTGVMIVNYSSFCVFIWISILNCGSTPARKVTSSDCKDNCMKQIKGEAEVLIL